MVEHVWIEYSMGNIRYAAAQLILSLPTLRIIGEEVLRSANEGLG